MDPTALLDAAAPLGELLRDMALTAVGAIIGGRLGWLFYRREMRVHRRRFTPSFTTRLLRLIRRA